MTRQELEAWLCSGSAPRPTSAEVAAVLGAALDTPGVRFVVAVLRDVFADDHGVHRWLCTPRVELGGRTGLDLLRASGGQSRAVEELAVREWHGPAAAGAPVALMA